MLSVLVRGQLFCNAVKESIGVLGGIILLLHDLVSSDDVHRRVRGGGLGSVTQ